ncbi:MAG TPA: hypothetical protein VGI19_01990 [Candidatus Cybelea sp.]|jgi:hypothetical protein
MQLFITLGRVKSFVGVPGSGGYKVYLTDGVKQWVELGGGGATGNPYGLPRQPARGFDSEADAERFARDLFYSLPEVAQSPLDFHRLYAYAATGELYFGRSVPLARMATR